MDCSEGSSRLEGGRASGVAEDSNASSRSFAANESWNDCIADRLDALRKASVFPWNSAARIDPSKPVSSPIMIRIAVQALPMLGREAQNAALHSLLLALRLGRLDADHFDIGSGLSKQSSIPRRSSSSSIGGAVSNGSVSNPTGTPAAEAIAGGGTVGYVWAILQAMRLGSNSPCETDEPSGRSTASTRDVVHSVLMLLGKRAMSEPSGWRFMRSLALFLCQSANNSKDAQDAAAQAELARSVFAELIVALRESAQQAVKVLVQAIRDAEGDTMLQLPVPQETDSFPGTPTKQGHDMPTPFSENTARASSQTIQRSWVVLDNARHCIAIAHSASMLLFHAKKEQSETWLHRSLESVRTSPSSDVREHGHLRSKTMAPRASEASVQKSGRARATTDPNEPSGATHRTLEPLQGSLTPGPNPPSLQFERTAEAFNSSERNTNGTERQHQHLADGNDTAVPHPNPVGTIGWDLVSGVLGLWDSMMGPVLLGSSPNAHATQRVLMILLCFRLPALSGTRSAANALLEIGQSIIDCNGLGTMEAAGAAWSRMTPILVLMMLRDRMTQQQSHASSIQKGGASQSSSAGDVPGRQPLAMSPDPIGALTLIESSDDEDNSDEDAPEDDDAGVADIAASASPNANLNSGGPTGGPGRISAKRVSSSGNRSMKSQRSGRHSPGISTWLSQGGKMGFGRFLDPNEPLVPDIAAESLILLVRTSVIRSLQASSAKRRLGNAMQANAGAMERASAALNAAPWLFDPSVIDTSGPIQTSFSMMSSRSRAASGASGHDADSISQLKNPAIEGLSGRAALDPSDGRDCYRQMPSGLHSLLPDGLY